MNIVCSPNPSRLYLLCVCLFVSRGTPGVVLGHLWELVLSFSRVGPQVQTQVVRVGARHPSCRAVSRPSMFISVIFWVCVDWGAFGWDHTWPVVLKPWKEGWLAFGAGTLFTMSL